MTHRQHKHPLSLIRSFWDDGDFFDLIPTTNKGFKATGVSLSEDEKHVYVEAALPGLGEDNIDVTLEKGVLWIQGKKEQQEDGKKYHYRSDRSYSYQIPLPECVDETIEPEASYKNGMLTISFQKTTKSTAKKISVKRS